MTFPTTPWEDYCGPGPLMVERDPPQRWSLFLVIDDDTSEYYLALDFADAVERWRGVSEEAGADDDYQPHTVQRLAGPSELHLPARL